MRKSKISELSKDELKKIVESSQSLHEVLSKTGYSSCSGTNRETVKKKINEYNISTDHFRKGNKNGLKRSPDNIFIYNSSATQAVLRRWFLKGNYIPYKCSICGLGHIWQGKELSLTLDHINGDNKDNRMENLRWVCPNCDRQLETFGSKNKRKF